MAYLLRRLGLFVLVLLGASLLIFGLVRLLPGDITTTLAGAEGALSAEQRKQILSDFGLDQPWPIQYVYWARSLLSGDLGYSFRNSRPVAELVVERLPLTAELAILSTLAATAIGIPLGVVASRSRHGFVRASTQAFGLLGLSVPNFWLGVVLIVVASSVFGWLPPLFFAQIWEDPVANLKQMFLPVLSLAVGLAAVIMRMTRSAMLETAGEGHVKVARAKGLSRGRVTRKHVLRNSLLPVVTVIGIYFGFLIGGVVLTEQVFGLPGLGWTLLNGVLQRDYPVVQAAILIFAASFATINLMTDVAYFYLDPRSRG